MESDRYSSMKTTHTVTLEFDQQPDVPAMEVTIPDKEREKRMGCYIRHFGLPDVWIIQANLKVNMKLGNLHWTWKMQICSCLSEWCIELKERH